MNTMSPCTASPSDAQSISEQVIDSVAEKKGVDPLMLDPIYDVVDPDALDSLVNHPGTEDCEITFRYESHFVTVGSDGVGVSPIGATSDRAPAAEE